MKPFTAKARAMTLAEVKQRRKELKSTISEACSELDAMEREMRRQERRARKAARTGAVLAGLLAMLPAIAATPPASAPAAQAELLLIERTYDGPVERAGVLLNYQYTSGAMLIEWADTTTDGIFRSGFEASP